MIPAILAVIEDRSMDELCDLVCALTPEQRDTLRDLIRALTVRIERERAEAATAARKGAMIEITAWATETL